MENLYDAQHIEVPVVHVCRCNARVPKPSYLFIFSAFVFIVSEVVVVFCSHWLKINEHSAFKRTPIENKDGELGWKQDIQISLTCCVMLRYLQAIPQSDSQTAQKNKEPVSRSAPATHSLWSGNSLDRNGLQWIPAELQTEEDSRAKGTVVVSSWAPHFHWEKTHSAVAATLAVKSSGHSL